MAVFTAAAAIGASILGTTVAATGFTFAFIGQAALGFAAQAALGLALNALTPKPKLGNFSGNTARQGYTVNQRGSALEHQIIYGTMRTGGVVVFDGTTGTNNKFLHRVIAFTGHEIESFDEIYINDAKVSILESDGNVKEIELPDGTLSNRYDGFIRINKQFGGDDQEADSDLVAEVPEWTAQHRLRGVSYLYARLKFNSDKFPNGVPQITATIKGKKVFDPRTSTTAFSDNPALCLRDYILAGYGLAEDLDNIDDSLVIAAANVCDETNTIAGTKRYTCNGAFTTATTPYDLLQDMLTSMGGLLWYAQGQWRMKPAYYVAPTVSFDEDDLRSNIAVQTRHSRRDNFNTVRGTFRGPETDYQVTDYPEVTNAAFLSADGGQESVADIELPFTDTSVTARRIALIALERNRQQLTVQASFGLRAFQVQVGDIIQLSVERFGWTNKEFEVSAWTFGLTDSQDLQVQMVLREISENVFDEVSDGVVFERDNTTLLSPFEVPAIGINATAVTQVLREKLTNVINVVISAGRPEGIDRVEVEFKESSEPEDQFSTVGTGELGLFRIVDVETGNYDIRARAVNTFGVKGEFEFLNGVSADGLLGPPSNVDGLTAEVNGATIHLEWNPIPDLDLSYYQVRHSIEETGATFANATTAVDKVPRPASAVSLPTRPGTYHIKAVDKSGITSLDFTSVVVPEANLQEFANTLTQTEDPTFSGTKTGCSVVSGALEITDPSSAPSTATYDFSDYIDTGAPRRVRSRVETNVVRKDETAGLFDDLPGQFDDLPGLFDDFTGDADFADTNVQAFISITQDDPAGTPTYTDYQLFRAGEYFGRAFRFRVVLSSTSDDITPSITGLKALVEYD
jgi:hypothetical protein